VAYVTRLDGETLHRGVVVEAAAAAAPHAVPVVVVTERSEVSRREWSTAGLSGVHEAADGDIARVARTWTPGWAHRPRTDDGFDRSVGVRSSSTDRRREQTDGPMGWHR
jgi:hypothetical protein